MKSDESSDKLAVDQERLHVSALIDNLKLTPEERIEAHQATLQLVEDLRQAGERLRAKSK